MFERLIFGEEKTNNPA